MSPAANLPLLKELAEAWETAAWHNTVFPLEAGLVPGRRRAESELSLTGSDLAGHT